ncbi:ATP-binding protein [Sphingobacterium sp. SGR-19]|uniref:ATP-binding protein n=1 Tax=Sphingobacterium sp. SGR-19 TaxID=2710886 RepID=UPI0019CF781A|nr:AAA family ATPase [Sphingobacterium sp. SGR-19]
MGGELLLIDEVHKYPNWSRELKLIYDGFPKMQVLFTSSSALDLYRGESDLSRRLVTQFLHGMSFREFLYINYDYDFKVLKLADILHHQGEATKQITAEIKVLPLFKEYLNSGYFPFANSGNSADFGMKFSNSPKWGV